MYILLGKLFKFQIWISLLVVTFEVESHLHGYKIFVYNLSQLDTKQSIKVSDISICDISSLSTKQYPRFIDAHGWKEKHKPKGLQKFTKFYKLITRVAWKLEYLFLNSLYKKTTVGCGSKARVKEKKERKY